MRAPEFWAHDGLAGRLLAPLGLLYDGLGALRFRLTRPVDCGLPVLCVGNLTLGGAGKTPVVQALALHFQARGRAVQLVTRGYGGWARGPLLVDPAQHDAGQVGDEALLLARVAPTWVARSRPAGARAAAAAGAELILLDDGFQNPSLAKDLSLIVLDGAAGLGNGRVFPAGPLRERPARALARAQGLVVLGDDPAGLAERLAGALPVLRGTLAPTSGTPDLAGRRVVAFAGIGRPAKFFATLRQLGAELVATEAFPDHHPYSRAQVEALLAQAERLEATAITTAKDWVRLPGDLAARVQVLPVQVAWADPEALDRLLLGL